MVDKIILIGSLIVACTTIITAINKILKKLFAPMNTKIDNIDKNQCRNYLVDFLADIESGMKKDECQIERAYELYDHYTKDLNGNSYIHDKWGKLMNGGKRK